MTKLNKYGDDFKNATLPLPIEDDSMLHLMSINNPIAPSFPASRGLAGLVSKSQRKSTVGRPRAGRPRLISEMTSRNDNLRQPSGRGGKRKRMATQGKLEKDKDPLAPKKPANAFMMFCQTMRQEEMSTKEQDGAGSDLSHQELTRQLAQKWNFLGAGEKETYYSMYERDKDRYHREMKEYIKSNNPEPLPTTKPTPQPPTDSVAKTEPVSSDQPNPTKAPCPVKSEPKPETKQQPPSTSASSTLNAPSTCSVTKPEISIPVKREPKTDGLTLESRTPKLKSSLHPKSPVEGDDPYHFDDD
ncbi:proteoglycan 4-like isoform X2 [Acanthaster planci]|nr:proteoglycan 4-like isoform X2 [Acanthaster planci]